MVGVVRGKVVEGVMRELGRGMEGVWSVVDVGCCRTAKKCNLFGSRW